MKKIFTFAFSTLLGLTAAAQGVYQFADPSFEDWDADNEPGKGWTSFASADASALGDFIGNIAKNNSPKPEKVEGHTGTTAVRLFSKSILGANANGNLTTGQIHMGSATPTDASNYNSTKVGDAAHSLVFAGTPDAVGFYAKFKSGGSENGRGNFILHDECEYKDPEVADQAANRIGIATALIPATEEWAYFEAPFVYDRTEKPATQYLLASFTTNPVPGGSANDTLIIDDVYFIYYNTLSALSYDGYALDVTGETKDFDLLPFAYDAEKLAYTAKGAGAAVETAYDESTGVLTITVKGNDFSVNSENFTTYTIRFATSADDVQGIYQFADPGFENWTSDSEPGNGWNSFASAGGPMGGLGFLSPAPEKVEGHTGEAAVKIISKDLGLAKANGNLTTGQINMGNYIPDDPNNYNATRVADAGHRLVFAGTPDAVGFYAKFKSGGSENGRGNFILHDFCDYQDPEAEAQLPHRVGKASVLIPATEEWARFEAPFVYDRAEKPAVQYLLASFTTNPVPGGSADDELIIDDVYFVYYNTLSALGYDGNALDLTSGTTDFDMNPLTYDAEKLAYTVKGVAATVETAYDETTCLLTITVKGNDYGVNSESVTTYRLQFSAGEPVIPAEPLGEKLSSLSDAAPEKTYVLYNEHYTAYAIYNAAITNTQLWAAEMTGDDTNALSNPDYSRKLDTLDEGSSWMLLPKGEGYCLYNMGLKKYLTTDNAEVPGVCGFSAEPVVLKVVELGDGNFAFNATDDSQGYMCASPQREAPVCLWTSSDAGSAWQLIENPNIAADMDVFNTVTGIGAVQTAQPRTGVYTIGGVRLENTANLPKGIYIVNGKKTVIGR